MKTKNNKKLLGVLVDKKTFRTVERVARANSRSKTYVAEKFLEAGINTLENLLSPLGVNTCNKK